MNTNDTQQEHIYNERIQEFFPLFDKKDDPIYNARVDFNTVKFLTERADWDWNEDKDKNKACGVILQECNKTEKAEQKLESEVKARLKEYVDDVAGVSIYGNHASITLGDDKKEFKISEFLNSDFCQKKGISGFSTLHSDGKSGMHGFVAEEEGKKIRHYIVTDGSYEMTLKWYAEGKECKIKIKIDANGVDLVKGDDFSLERLEANRDVKIGGLFLHEIEFREKGKVNEVQHDGKDNQVLNKSSEIAIKSNSRDIEQEVKKPVQKHQATHMNREIGFQTPPLPPLRTSSLPPKENVVNEQGGSKLESRKPDRSKQTPNNQQQPETQQQEGKSEQEPKGEKLNYKKGESSSEPEADGKSELSSNTADVAQKRFLEDVLEKIKEDKPIYKWLKDKIEGKEDNQNLDVLEGRLSKKYGQGNIVEKKENDDGKPLSPVNTEENIDAKQSDGIQLPQDSYKSGQEPIEEELNYQNAREALENWKEKRPKKYEINEDIKETSFNTPEKIQSELQKDDLADVKTVESPTVSVSASTPNSISDSGYVSPTNGDSKSQTDLKQVGRKLEEHINLTPFEKFKNTLGQKNLGLKPADQSQISEETKKRLREVGLLKDSSTDVKTNDSGYSSPTHANHEQSRVNSGQLKASLMNVEQRDDTLLTEFTSKLDKETQKFPLKPVDQKEMSEQTKEHLLATGLLKENAAETKINDSGYSSPTYTSHYNFQVSPEQLGKRLETIESKKEDTLEKLNKGLKEPSQQATKTKDLFLDSMLEKIKEGKQYDPVRKLLERKVAEQENDNTNLTIDKNSKLYKLLEKDAAQLKVEVIEEERKDTLTEHTDSYDRNRIALGNRNKRPLDWAKRIAESQEKDTNKSILM